MRFLAVALVAFAALAKAQYAEEYEVVRRVYIEEPVEEFMTYAGKEHQQTPVLQEVQPMQTRTLPVQYMPVERASNNPVELPTEYSRADKTHLPAQVNRVVIERTVYQPELIEQPIVRKQHIDQPMVRRRIVEVPVVQRVVTQPVLHTRVVPQPILRQRIIEQPVLQPRIIEQTFLQPRLEKKAETAEMQQETETVAPQPITAPAETVRMAPKVSEVIVERAAPQTLQMDRSAAKKSH